MKIEEVVDRQLLAYNNGDYKSFADCYHENICSYDLQTAKLNPEMSGTKFFAHYKRKLNENPSIHCQVTDRIVQGNLVIDKEIISGHEDRRYEDLVIYEVEQGRISKMWFSNTV